MAIDTSKLELPPRVIEQSSMGGGSGMRKVVRPSSLRPLSAVEPQHRELRAQEQIAMAGENIAAGIRMKQSARACSYSCLLGWPAFRMKWATRASLGSFRAGAHVGTI